MKSYKHLQVGGPDVSPGNVLVPPLLGVQQSSLNQFVPLPEAEQVSCEPAITQNTTKNSLTFNYHTTMTQPNALGMHNILASCCSGGNYAFSSIFQYLPETEKKKTEEERRQEDRWTDNKTK